MNGWKNRALTLGLIFSVMVPFIAYTDETRVNTESPKKKISLPDTELKIPKKPQNNSGRILYIPPKPEKAAPQVRVGTGGTRGIKKQFPIVTLLVPEHVARTIQAQPTLYWHISTISQLPFIVTLITDDRTTPLLELTIKDPLKPGIHSLRLADYGVHLQTGKTYEWLVSIPFEPGQYSSDDLVAKGYINRSKPASDVETALIEASSIEKAKIYAQNGFWYDALETLSKQTSSIWEENQQCVEKSNLLEQVGIYVAIETN